MHTKQPKISIESAKVGSEYHRKTGTKPPENIIESVRVANKNTQRIVRKLPKSAEKGAKTAIFRSKVRESDPESRESTGIDAAKSCHRCGKEP